MLILCRLRLYYRIQNTEHQFWGVGPTGNGSNEWGKALERLRHKFQGFAQGIVQSSPYGAINRARLDVFQGTNPRPSFDIMSSHPVIYNGKRYPTSFHLYQSLKVYSPVLFCFNLGI
jgi:predicted NAD-dependent protein-ADP-ribosyltransferase YbiA (DUF1768 family)